MSNRLVHNNALIYAIGLNDLNLALDAVEAELELASVTESMHYNLTFQQESLQKAIAQWDDRFLDHVQDKIRLK